MFRRCRSLWIEMPRGNFNVSFASRGPHLRAEEAAGIALLVVIFTALLLLGCWYFRRRNGYKMIRNPSSAPSGFGGGQFGEGGAGTVNKMGHSELRPVLPNAPPAYEKIPLGPLPPPYSP
ncbi:hypothetical protein UPYG_G00286680 [Umbra pygmaea]|uniref:Melan-A n=1 Tax=Umbra pygmaea TaxID=75934 RepID=A0ABD0W8E1_UMBPY